MTPAELAAKLKAARLEQSRRAISVRVGKAAQLQAAPKLEWWQREKSPPKGPPGAPKPPSAAQWSKLATSLWEVDCEDHSQPPSKATVLAWVKFSNAYWPGPYTSIHFSIALDLMLSGRNVYGAADDLMAFAEGEPLPEPDIQYHIARRRVGYGKKKSGPAKARPKSYREVSRGY